MTIKQLDPNKPIYPDNTQIIDDNFSEIKNYYLHSSNNLSDVDDISVARTNLDVYSKSETDGLIPDVSGKEDKSNKATNLNSPDNTKYPTTKAVADALANQGSLPDQTGQGGKFLGTNGTDASWQTVNTKLEDEANPKLGGNLNANSKKITGLANGTASGDAVNKSQLDGKENSFAKNTAFNKNFGTTAGTVAEGNHTHTKAQVGLGNVDNTSDANKPVSTATQTALNNKQDKLVSGTNIKTVGGITLLGSGNIDGGTGNIGYKNIPQNLKNSNYTLVLDDAGKHIYNNGTTARTRTIPANSSVAFPIGTTITLVNDSNKDMTLAITTDTLVWTDDGTTGTRTVKPQGLATIMKVTATRRFISGVNIE